MEDLESSELRSAVPLSDDDIRRIWREASSGESHSPTPPWASSFLILLALACVLIALGVLANGQVEAVIPVLFMIVSGACFLLAGVYSATKMKKEAVEDVSVSNPSVLKTVIDQVSQEPIRQARNIKIKVEAERSRLQTSLLRLEDIVSRLSEQISGTADSTLRLMIEAKKSSAEDAHRQLKDADEELAARWKEADEAVRPVQEMVVRFQTLWRLTSDITEIREAFKLAEHAAEEAEHQRLEVAYLRAVATKAIGQLTQIEASLDAGQRARLEVGTLTTSQRDAFETVFANQEDSSEQK